MPRATKASPAQPDTTIRVTYVFLGDLKHSSLNAKEHDLRFLKESIRQHGFADPLLRNSRTGKVIAGEGRMDALTQMEIDGESVPHGIMVESGRWKVPVVDREYSDRQAKAVALAYNRSQERGGWNKPVLAELLTELAEAGELESAGFTQAEFDRLIEQTAVAAVAAMPDDIEGAASVEVDDDGAIRIHAAEPEESEGNGDQGEDQDLTIDDRLDVLGGAFQLRNDLFFASPLPWGVPELRPDMLVQEVPANLRTWGEDVMTPDDGVSTWLYIWGQHTRGLPFDRAVLGWYTYDYVFERLWAEPSKMIAKMLNAGVRTSLTPDFSLYAVQPPAIQLFQLYRGVWAARYFQEAGIKVIPSLPYTKPEHVEWATLGIPKRCPVMSCELQSINDLIRKGGDIRWIREYFEAAIDRIRPESLIVYANATGQKIMDSCVFKHKVNIVPLETRGSIAHRKLKSKEYAKTRSDLHVPQS